MLKRTRVSNKLDTNRLGAALERPGIDPRINTAIGWVTKFVVDPDHGVFATVLLQNQQTLTCRVGTCYGGQGWGFYAPLEVDDEVVVSIPIGDPDHGPVVVAKTWAASELPPQDALDNQADVILFVKKDTNLRIKVAGSGNVVLGAEDGKVLLGDETGTLPVARKTDPTGNTKMTVTPGAGPLAGAIASISITGADGATTQIWSVADPGPFPVPDGEITDGSEKVESS